MGFIDAAQLEQLGHPMRNNQYGQYLLELARGGFQSHSSA
jgi:hypothetical protein